MTFDESMTAPFLVYYVGDTLVILIPYTSLIAITPPSFPSVDPRFTNLRNYIP